MMDFKWIGTTIISAMIVIGFIYIFQLAYLHNDVDTVKVLSGIIAGAMSMVVAFWIGSSVGSRNKDEIIQQQQQQIHIQEPNFPKTPRAM